MATVSGVVATAVAAGGLSNKQLSGVIDGRVKAMIDQYTSAGTEGVGTIIKMGQVLPTGANVIGVLLACTTAQAAVTISVGDQGSGRSAKYASASTAFQSAAASLLAALDTGHIVGAVTSDNQIILTTAGATLAAGVWTAIILYTLD